MFDLDYDIFISTCWKYQTHEAGTGGQQGNQRLEFSPDTQLDMIKHYQIFSRGQLYMIKYNQIFSLDTQLDMIKYYQLLSPGRLEVTKYFKCF